MCRVREPRRPAHTILHCVRRGWRWWRIQGFRAALTSTHNVRRQAVKKLLLALSLSLLPLVATQQPASAYDRNKVYKSADEARRDGARPGDRVRLRNGRFVVLTGKGGAAYPS